MICITMAFLPADLIFHPHDEYDFLPNSHFHGLKRSSSFSGIDRCDDLHNSGAEDELSDDGSSSQVMGLGLSAGCGGEKKRRLNLEQVKALEKSFAVGNKLEPERKLQLARALGLQPRQIAIWFQNRRARWKTKQIEKDYDVLKKQFDAVKAHNDALRAQNQELHAQLLALKSTEGAVTSLKKEADDSWRVYGSDHQGNADDMFWRTGLFPPPSLQRPTMGTSLFLRGSLSPSADITHYGSKISVAVQDGGFFNMAGGGREGIEDRPGVWSWPEPDQPEPDQPHHFD